MTRTDVHVTSVYTYKPQADYLQASLGYLLTWAELEQTVGRTPGLSMVDSLVGGRVGGEGFALVVNEAFPLGA